MISFFFNLFLLIILHTITPLRLLECYLIFQVPLHKEPRWLWDTIDRWLNTKETVDINNVPQFAKCLLDVNLREEAKWLKETLTTMNSPVVFCHNDMQEGNILLVQDENENRDDEQKLVLIGKNLILINVRRNF